jgi:hypothetical protein
VEQGEIPVECLGGLRLGRRSREVEASDMVRLIELLLAANRQGATELALDLAHDWKAGGSEVRLPEDLLLRLLQQALATPQDGAWHRLGPYFWEQLADQFLGWYPQRRIDLLRVTLERAGGPDGWVLGIGSRARQALERVLEADPPGSWACIAAILANLRHPATWVIRSWLAGNLIEDGEEDVGGPILFLRREDLWAWADAAPEQRLSWLTGALPRTLDGEGGAFTKAFLERYGESEAIRDRIRMRFWEGGFFGSEAAHWRQRLAQAEAWSEREEHSHVLRWLGEYRADLDNRIRAAAVREERER